MTEIHTGVEDYKVGHEFKDLHPKEKDLWHVMNWFPSKFERSMHKVFIMGNKLGITKQRKYLVSDFQVKFDSEIVDLHNVFKKERIMVGKNIQR